MSRIATAALMLVLAHTLAAQDTPPTFKAESQVVVLDVVARDGRGRLVSDLRPDEIQVFEDGQPCTIVSFRLVRGLAVDPGNAATTGSPARAEPAEEASTTPSRANLVVLLFDPLSVANAAAARRGALDLLSQRFPPDTWFAVYKIHRSMRLLQPFTSDARQLVAAVVSATSGDDANRGVGPAAPSMTVPAPPSGPSDGAIPASPDLPSGPDAPIAQVARGVEREIQDLAGRVAAYDSLYGIRALARGLREIRGRKTILYFAEDREIPESAVSVYDSTIGVANRANVTVHTVDTRGLALTRPGDRSAVGSVLRGMSASAPNRAQPQWNTAGAEGAPYRGADGPGGPMIDRENPVQGSFLAHVAHDTGGLAIAHTNDLGAGLASVVEEVGQYYEVVYEPPRPERDGRFRRITTKVTRRGVRLRTRSGYFANTGSAPTIAGFELPLLAAIGATQPPHDFAHAATVMHFASAGREREVLFLAEVSLGNAMIVEDPDRGTYHAHLAFLGFVRDEAGRTVARLSQDWPIEGPLAERARLASTTAVFRRPLTLPPGGYTLVTAIQDREANRTSVERNRFDVPPAEGGLALGSLVVIRKASGEPATGTDPLRVSGVSIAPQVGSGELPVGTREVPLFLPIYPSLAAAPVELQLEVSHAGETVARSTPQLPAAGPDGRIAWIGSLPTKGLAPGAYEVIATVRQGEAVSEERASFDLREGTEVAARADVAAASPPPVPADLVPVLEAAARYVLEYEESFQNIAADETYTQAASWQPKPTRLKPPGPHTGIEDELQEITVAQSCAGGTCRRVTKADIVFARLAGAVPWGCFRDVYEVDGRKVRDSDRRLEKLFTRMPFMSATQRATALLAESARYNFGPAIRNINFPTLALAFLHPMNQGRFAWSRGGRRRFGSVEGVEVQFDEVARPTIVDRGGQGDLPARGRFWIHPQRGTVLRSETSFRFEMNDARIARAFVATEYRPEPKLAMWVPIEMREEYENVPYAAIRPFRGRTEATARYGGFRRFTVTTEEEAHVPTDELVPR
jgi:VWFA-related protein